MRVPLSWLREYVDFDLSIEETAALLTSGGLEVESITRYGLPGAELEWDRERIVLSRLLRVEQHPDADRLVLATVDYGAAEPKTVVTGAPNLFPYIGRDDLSAEGLYSPLALEGALLYDGHKEGRIKAKLKGRPLRGIYNDAMLCSEKELGISDDHEGIILVTGDELRVTSGLRPVPGTPLADVLGDAVVDIAILPNTARATSIIGVARELAALTGATFRPPSYDVIMDGPPIDGRVIITTDEPGLNPRFTAMLIEGVRQIPSPYWMQYRLRLCGQRPINAVVDISNYVMLEVGQPNHTFDYDVLRRRADGYAPDGTKPGANPIHIHTRLPYPGETLTTLDGATHKLEPYTILVTDPAGNLSVGGIMGGLESEITDDTTNVLLEAAAWDFINIRRSANALDLHTEAAFRFSRGVAPSLALLGAKRAAELLRLYAGGIVARGIVDTYPNPQPTVVVDLDPVYARKLSGLDLTPAEMGELLERLEFRVEYLGDQLRVTAPDHRMDIEGPHDLVEEICRVYGYDRIPNTLLADALPPQRGNEKLEGEERVRDVLARLGLQEIWSYRLTSAAREARLMPGGPANEPLANNRRYVTLTNPPAPDRNVLRHSILSSALEATAANSRHAERIALFEIGQVFIGGANELLPDELTQMAIVMTGRRVPSGWNDNNPVTHDFFDLKGILDAFFADLHVPVIYERVDHPTYRPGRTARIMAGEQLIGLMGELHPAVVKGFELRVERDQPVLAADIDLEALLPLVPTTYRYTRLPAYPPVREDLALVVDADMPAADVEAALRQNGGPLLRDVALFDVYEGGQLPPGKKSLAYHLTFLSDGRTLTDKDVSKQRGRLLKALERQLDAKIRE
ncbi:MAG: phenylalanine--tRNA ligase subunit beta [Anaerolineae bacterium]|nr:phenylalanine--tRNA ligase subunit beta [Anaerolineae bacterium]